MHLVSIMSSIADKTKCKTLAKREDDGSDLSVGGDLSLSGSQISLVSRPRSVMGKASMRALTVSGNFPRRPMSALPVVNYCEGTRDKRRPYSADGQPVLFLSSLQQRRAKFASRFPLSVDRQSFGHNLHRSVQDFDGDFGFSPSTFASSYLSDQFSNNWPELDMDEIYLNKSHDVPLVESTDSSSDLFCCSDISEEATRSEKSLGERIKAMAQNPSPGFDEDKADKYDASTHSTNIDRRNACHSPAATRNQECDTKLLTTRELHLRMVEGGLILKSKGTPPGLPNLNDDGLSKGHRDTESFSRQSPKISFVDGVQNSLKDNEKSDFPFWINDNNASHSEYRIEQETFPADHDIESLEGDSGSRNCNKTTITNNLLEFKKATEGKTDDSDWVSNSLAPVRFQQWVSADSENTIETTTQNVQTYLSGTRNSPLLKKLSTFPDCTVEEVNDEFDVTETIKEHPVKSLESEKTFLRSMEDKNSMVQARESTSEVHRISPDQLIAKQSKIQITSLDGIHNFNNNNNNSSSSSVKQSLIEKDSSENGKTTLKQIKFDRRTDSVKNTGKQQSTHNLCNKKADNFKDSENNGKATARLLQQSRYLSHVSDTSVSTDRVRQNLTGNFSQRARRNTYNCRTIPKPKEEEFPSESQPELISWMSMCSEQFKESSLVSCDGIREEPSEKVSAPPSTPITDQASDSPYSEIMTILRVLEDEEDESSLAKILAKRNVPVDSNSTRATSEPVDVQQPSTPAVNEKSVSTKMQETSPITRASHNEPEIRTLLTTPSAGGDSGNVERVQNQAQEPQELKNLLTFLDAVDRSCSNILESSRFTPCSISGRQSSPIQVSNLSVMAESNGLEELLLLSHTDLAQEVVKLRLALEERDATISLLKTALREHREGQERRDAANATELDKRVRQIKSECEGVVKRHQKFIDQLIADKGSLSERCEALLIEARESEERYKKNIDSIEQKHKIELQRMKDITTATEKLKRERWVENKTQKIKELTVRGLEPELTRLTAQHEQEMSALRTLHAQELEQMELRATRRASQQMETLREQLLQEKEEALARERDSLRQRMEKEQTMYEEEGAEQRRRLVTEVRRERDRLATHEARLETQFEERKRSLEREFENETDRIRREYAEKVDALHRKQQNEISHLRESLQAEKDAWISSYQKQQQQFLSQSTSEIRDQLKRERDKEIEIVIERLEKEATLSREEKEKAAENKLRRLRDQMSGELKEVESELITIKEKYGDVRNQLQDKEDQLASIETQNRSLQTQLTETRRIADQLSAERADLKQVLRLEINSELEALRHQLSEQHSRHQEELKTRTEQGNRERLTYQQELQQLYARVKLAIAKKEDVIKVSKEKQKAAEEQCAHLQALLELRRREALQT